RGPGGVFYQEEFDPEEIFNMFFGAKGEQPAAARPLNGLEGGGG
ncbi:hypothetical protein HaLaN_30191, partial [Haematococcus lacustris]